MYIKLIIVAIHLLGWFDIDFMHFLKYWNKLEDNFFQEKYSKQLESSHEKALWRFLTHCNIYPDFPALSNLLPAPPSNLSKYSFEARILVLPGVFCGWYLIWVTPGPSLWYRYQILRLARPNVATVDTIPVLSRSPLFWSFWHFLSLYYRVYRHVIMALVGDAFLGQLLHCGWCSSHKALGPGWREHVLDV